MFGGYVPLASHWLKMEAAASKALASPADAAEEPAFYQAKIQTSAFVFDRLLPRCGASTMRSVTLGITSVTLLGPSRNGSTERECCPGGGLS